MQPVELTFLRSLKVWWSFLWRTWVFMIPCFVLLGVIAAIGFFATGGMSTLGHNGKMDPSAMSPMFALVIGLLYLVFIPATLAIQIIALKLALKVKWSDFYFVPVSKTGAPILDAQVLPGE